MDLSWITIVRTSNQGLFRPFLFFLSFLVLSLSFSFLSSALLGRDMGDRTGRNLKVPLAPVAFKRYQANSQNVSKVIWCPFHHQAAPCILHKGQIAPVSCCSPWGTAGHSALPLLLQTTPAEVSEALIKNLRGLCALIKWQSSHPETFSIHGVSNLCCRPSAQQLSLPGGIHCWPHSPGPPSQRMANTSTFRWAPSHVCRNEVNQEECAGGLVLPHILGPGPAILCMPLPWGLRCSCCLQGRTKTIDHSTGNLIGLLTDGSNVALETSV